MGGWYDGFVSWAQTVDWQAWATWLGALLNAGAIIGVGLLAKNQIKEFLARKQIEFRFDLSKDIYYKLFELEKLFYELRSDKARDTVLVHNVNIDLLGNFAIHKEKIESYKKYILPKLSDIESFYPLISDVTAAFGREGQTQISLALNVFERMRASCFSVDKYLEIVEINYPQDAQAAFDRGIDLEFATINEESINDIWKVLIDDPHDSSMIRQQFETNIKKLKSRCEELLFPPDFSNKSDAEIYKDNAQKFENEHQKQWWTRRQANRNTPQTKT